MQFHHRGYVSGDPRILPAAGTGLNRPDELPDEIDVLIVGTGPAGIVTAAQLSMYPSVTTRIIDRRPGRLEIGQADGIQARSVETFQAFGFAERIIAEAYRISEMAFWKPDHDDPSRIVRAAVAIDDEQGISEFPHLLVNQARVLDYFTEFMAQRPHTHEARLRLRVPRPRDRGVRGVPRRGHPDAHRGRSTRARSASCERGTSSARTARAAACARPSARSTSARRPSTRGA